MKEFTEMTNAEIDAFLVTHAEELHMDLQAGELVAAIEAGKSVVERSRFAFAVIDLAPMPDGFSPHLRALYVRRDMRGRKHGRAFLRAVMRKHAVDYHMSLSCYGPLRRAFFGRLGFRVESRDGEWRRMTTNDYRGFSGF